MNRRVATTALALLLATVPVMTSCAREAPPSSEVSKPKPPNCALPAINVSPNQTTAGQEITVSASAAACDLGYGDTQEYRFDIYRFNGDDRFDWGKTLAQKDGSFSYTANLPGKMAPGDYGITVDISGPDGCADTGASAQCAAYSGSFTVKP